MASARVNCKVMTDAPAGTRRGHLAQARHLAELLFQRRGDGRGDDLGTRAGIEGLHLDGRIRDFGQRRQRQLQVGDRADDQYRDHQQRGRDRTQDEYARGFMRAQLRVSSGAHARSASLRRFGARSRAVRPGRRRRAGSRACRAAARSPPAAVGSRQQHLRAVAQTVAAFGDHDLAGA